MTPFGAVERMAGQIGVDIGRSNSHTQATLISGLAAGLLGGGWDDSALDMQCAYIADDLSPGAKALIVRLARFCVPEDGA